VGFSGFPLRLLPGFGVVTSLVRFDLVGFRFAGTRFLEHTKKARAIRVVKMSAIMQDAGESELIQ